MTTNYQVDGIDFDDIFIRKSLFQQGGMWSWGVNGYGQLGDNTGTTRSSPVQTVGGGTNWRQVSAGGTHTAAIKTDGTLWTWGDNSVGPLGTNDTTHRSSPVQTVSVGTNWRQVSAGGTHTAAIKTDGSLWLWGGNGIGQLGTNDTTNRSSPVQTVSSGTNWRQVSAGSTHTAAIKLDGSLWLWGANGNGSLGDNTLIQKSSPVQTVSGGSNWQQVSAGNFFTAAIKTDGTLWLWGFNGNGQLGDGTSTQRSSPVQTASGNTNWQQVATGYRYTAAIKTDGTLWAWGSNSYGWLGTVSGARTNNQNSPTQIVSGGTNWRQVDAGGGMIVDILNGNYPYNVTAAIKTDGTLWTWGREADGRLGDDGALNSNPSSPRQTAAGGTNWRQVSVGKDHSAAIRIVD